MWEKCGRNKYKERLMKLTIIIVLNIYNVTGKIRKKNGLIYILEWTSTDAEPFTFLEQKRKAFVARKCAFQNCYLTSNHSYFSDVLDFDVLIFNAAHMNSPNISLPEKRSQSQKYIMVAMEPAGFYPLPARFDDFFNFTWTYKLDSDVPFPYIVIRNSTGEVIGPKVDMHWMKIEEMGKISDVVKNKTVNKHIAAAWFVSNCISYQRLNYVRKLKAELANYGHRVDIYGRCGNYNCPWKIMNECYDLIESDYYFYLAFENSFGEDYVSEKLLHALEHFAVPVVLGGANYSRFMPEGIYLDALKLEPKELAIRMSEVIKDKNKYYEFFKWHGNYSFHLTGEDSYLREVCGLCELLNNNVLMNQTTIVSNISKWWNEESPFLKVTSKPVFWNRNEEHLKLLLDEEEVHDTGVHGFVSKLYNLVFGS